MTSKLDEMTLPERLVRLRELAGAVVDTVSASAAPLYFMEAVRLAGDQVSATTNDAKIGFSYAKSKGLVIIENGFAKLGVAARDILPGQPAERDTDAASERQSMTEAWHAASDHAADGAEFGSFTCNCVRVAGRAHGLGWRPTS